MSNDTQIAAHIALVRNHIELVKERARYDVINRSMAAVEASARQLSEQPVFVEWLKTREADSYSCSLLVRDALARLTASPTAPSTEASEPVRDERADFEAWAIGILCDNPTWKESAPYELAWQSWQARALKGTP